MQRRKPRRDETYAEREARYAAAKLALNPRFDAVAHARMSWRYYLTTAQFCGDPGLRAHALDAAAVWRRHLARAKWQTNRRAAA